VESENAGNGGPLVLLGGLDLGVFLPVAISGLLPCTNAGIISSGDEKIPYDGC